MVAALKTPTGYFRDHSGRVHPIFSSEHGVREPMDDPKEWKNSLSEGQRFAVEQYWTQDAGKDMRRVAQGSHPKPGHTVSLIGGEKSGSDDTYKEILSQFNEAVHTAPTAKGDIYRGIHELSSDAFDHIFNAKSLRANGPASFTTNPERSYGSPYDGQNTITLTAREGKHNAGDISNVSYYPEEKESVVPQGSSYKVLQKSFTTDKRGGRSGHMEIALTNKDEPEAVAMAAKEAPTGFFKKDGKVHPIFTSPGGHREPSSDTNTWKASLGKDQVHAVKRWIMGGYGDPEAGDRDWKGMKAAARGDNGPFEPPDNADKTDLDSFNRAVHTAPVTKDRIGRLLNLRDEDYNRLVSSKYLKTRSPVSFTARTPGADATSEEIRLSDEPPYSGIDQTHPVKIVSDDHNAADLRAFNSIENEAVVPQGSLYRVDKVDVRDSPGYDSPPSYHGEHLHIPSHPQTATVHISVVPSDTTKEKEAAEMSVFVKRSKSSVDFESPARGPHPCIRCVHFQSPNACAVVAGNVHPSDWCKLFDGGPEEVKLAEQHFFTDQGGHIHPISEASHKWKQELTSGEKDALGKWFLYSDSMNDPEMFPEKKDDFASAVQKAPIAKNPIYRAIKNLSEEQFNAITSATALQAAAHRSFSSLSDKEARPYEKGGPALVDVPSAINRYIISDFKRKTNGEDGYETGHAVLFKSEKHNAADVYAASPYGDEHEAIVPKGSTYRVTRVDVHESPETTEKGNYGHVLRYPGMKVATVHLELDPTAKPSEKASLAAAGPPTGFFKDHSGKIHPIFTSQEGIRNPSSDEKAWKSKLNVNQRKAISVWSHGFSNNDMKKEAKGEPHDSPVATDFGGVPWGKRLSDFNAAVHTAPVANGTIYRGMNNLSDETFAKLTNSTVLHSTSPVSFTTDKNSFFVPKEYDLATSNDIALVASKHNAGDISSAVTDYSEHEVIVPQGSTYRVVKRIITTKPRGGKWARLEIEFAPEAREKPVEMASGSPTGYFKDKSGTIHPIFQSPGGVRDPRATSREWVGSLSAVEKSSIVQWKNSSKLFRDEPNPSLLNYFNTAIHRAPTYKGTIFRGISRLSDDTFDKIIRSTTLRANGPASFSKSQLASNAWAHKGAEGENENGITFISNSHNGGDISSKGIPNEQEVVVPQGSVYGVDKVEVYERPPKPTGDLLHPGYKPGGRHADVYISHVPGAEPKDYAKLARSPYVTGQKQAPAGFFRDKEGRVRPIFQSSKRAPMTVSNWKGSLTDEEKDALRQWQHSSTTLRTDASLFDGFGNREKMLLDTFNRAVHKAPSYRGTIYRGIHHVGENAFDQIINAKAIRSASPSSFTPNKAEGERFAHRGLEYPGANSVTFIASKHNGGHVASALTGPATKEENEVVVPQGSTYAIDKVDVTTLPKEAFYGGGRHADVYIRHVDDKAYPEETINLAAPHFFTDAEGKVHPMDTAERSRSSEEWQHKLTPEHQSAMTTWANDSGWMKMVNTGPSLGFEFDKSDQKWIDAYQKFQEASQLAPKAAETVTRAIRDLTDEQYNKIVNAKSMATKGPVSFTSEDLRNPDHPLRYRFGNNHAEAGRHVVVFAASPNNAGDISSTMGRWRDENEAIVPANSVYKVDRVDRRPMNDHFNGEEATVYLSLEDRKPSNEDVKLATEKRFFTDAHGTVHPLGPDEHDWSHREPSMNAGGWAGSLTHKQREAVSAYWVGSATAMKSAIAGKGVVTVPTAEAAGPFQEALHTAPSYNGTIMRGVHDLSSDAFASLINAKTIQAKSPSSFSKKNLLEDPYGQGAAFLGNSRPSKFAVAFVAGNHNGGDISLLNPYKGEDEVVVPTGSVYHVDKVELGDNPADIHVIGPGHGHFATMHISYAPEEKTAKVELAEQKFFTDRQGNVHPMGQRSPSSSSEEWQSKLTDSHKYALNKWTWLTVINGIKDYDRGKLHSYAELNGGLIGDNQGTWKDVARNFDEGIATAPEYKGPIQRGLHSLTTQQFNKIIKASTLTTRTPVSFDAGDLQHNDYLKNQYLATSLPNHHAVVFVTDKHNGADISSLSHFSNRGDRSEHEVIIPKGSTYKVDKVEVGPNTIHGEYSSGPDPKSKLAIVHLSLADEETPSKIELAGGFTDRQGKFHPISDESSNWNGSMSANEHKAMDYWTGSSGGHGIKKAQKGEAPSDTEAFNETHPDGWAGGHATPEERETVAKDWETTRHDFESAVAKAPKAEGVVYRGISNLSKKDFNSYVKATSIKTATHLSFTGDKDLAEFFADRISTPTGNNIVFETNNHNAKDISSSSFHKDEAEAVIPKGSVYKVDHVDVTDPPTFIGDNGKPYMKGKVAHVHLSYVPNETDAKVEMGRYFTDKQGKVHPLGSVEGGRSSWSKRDPSSGPEEWKSRLYHDHKMAVRYWTTGEGEGMSANPNADIKNQISHKPSSEAYPPAALNGTWADVAKRFQEAVYIAPTYDGTIMRGLHNLDDTAFNRITGAKSLQARSPISFDAGNLQEDSLLRNEYLGSVNGRHSVLFIADSHNGGDISSESPYSNPSGWKGQEYKEHEVVIPTGSRYRINSIEVRPLYPNTIGSQKDSKLATVHISLDPLAKEKPVEMAGYFTDKQGKVHPLSEHPVSKYRPVHLDHNEGNWDRSGDEPTWVQDHDVLVRQGLHDWKGDPTNVRLHVTDAQEGGPIPASGSGKIMRAQAEAILWEVENKGRSNDRTLYRGSSSEPYRMQPWSESKSVANKWAKKYKGQVYKADKGELHGLRVEDYLGHDSMGEQEWIAQPVGQPTKFAGSPTGFFKDQQGNVHPIFRSSGMRHPVRTKTQWKATLTPEQREAVHAWKNNWEGIKKGEGSREAWSKDPSSLLQKTFGLDSGGRDPKLYDTWAHKANRFEEAIDKAPEVKGPVYRGMTGLSDEQFDKLTKAKSLRSSSPVSFSSSNQSAYGFIAGKKSVMFIADKHNAADISSLTDVRGSDDSMNQEHEAVVPGGSTYTVDSVHVASHPYINPGLLATIHISYKPDATDEKAVKLGLYPNTIHASLAGSPTGYFKDKSGKVHPIFTNGGHRPAMDKDSWLKSITPSEKSAIHFWTSDSDPMRTVATERYGDENLTNDWKSALNDFNQVVDRAPQYPGTIYRGVHGISKNAFDSIVNAKTIKANGPASFTGTKSAGVDYAGHIYDDDPNYNGVLFVAKNHNGGHIRPAQLKQIGYSNENEVVVPQGSTYKIDKVKLETYPGPKSGRRATVYIHHEPGSTEPTEAKLSAKSYPSLAPEGFFWHNGAVHPIFKSSSRSRNPKRDWSRSLSPEHKEAINSWTEDQSSNIRDMSKGEYDADKFGTYAFSKEMENDTKKNLSYLNEAVDTAPSFRDDYGSIIDRGIGYLTDDKFNEITNAKILSTKAPTSFTSKNLEGLPMDTDVVGTGPIFGPPEQNSVLFIADKHNGADVHTASKYPKEQEVIVPANTPFHVTSVEKTTKGKIYNGKHAIVHISMFEPEEPDPPKETVSLATYNIDMASPGSPKGFFRDSSGKIHPISSGGGGGGRTATVDRFGPNDTLRNNPKPVVQQKIRDIANNYVAKAGLPPVRNFAPQTVKPAEGRAIANTYATAIDNPNDPQTREAYKALNKEVTSQWNALTKAGIKLEPWEKEGQPYQTSTEMKKDVDENGHLFYYKSGGKGNMPAKLMSLKQNDRFRAVHDVFGHAQMGNQFGPVGETNAYLEHSQMFSPKALRALTTETLAQNASYNFGRENEGKPAEQRTFPAQKASLLPENLYKGILDRRDAAIKKARMSRPPKEDYFACPHHRKRDSYQRISNALRSVFAEAPTGYFKDEQGNTHPIFQGSQGRHPSSAATWSGSMSPDERHSLQSHVRGDYEFVNQLARKGDLPSYAPHDKNHYGKILSDVNHAIDTAPAYEKPIYRSVRNLNDDAFAKIIGAKSISTTAPTSFSKNNPGTESNVESKSLASEGGKPAGHVREPDASLLGSPDKNSITFIADKHNGGDVGSVTGQQEVMVPSKTPFHINSVKTSSVGKIGTAKHAVVHVSMFDPNEKLSPQGDIRMGKARPGGGLSPPNAKMAGQHYFTDAHGKVHPLGDSSNEGRMKNFIEQGQNVWENSVRGGAKNTLVTEIARRMSADPETAKAFENVKKNPVGYGQPDTMYDQANGLVRGWAAMAGDNDNPIAVAHHIATAKEFGLDSKPFTNDPGVIKKANDILSSNGGAYEKLYRGFLKAEYSNTQDQLKAAGIDHVTLNRGMTWDPPSSPDWVKGLQPRSTKETPSTVPNGNDESRSKDLSLPLQPVTSWTANPEANAPLGAASTGKGYYESTLGSSHFVNLRTTVPREKILSTARTGRGALPEYEVTVLGGPTQVHAVRMDHASSTSFGRTHSYPDSSSDKELYAKFTATGFFRDKQGRIHPISEGGGHGHLGYVSPAMHKSEGHLLKSLNDNGGFTFHAYTGEEPSAGYSVSIHKDRERQVVNPTKEDLHSYAASNDDLLRQPDRYFGAWNEDGKTFLDVSRVVPTAEEAESIGRENNQLAYYGFREGQSFDIDPEKSQHAQPEDFVEFSYSPEENKKARGFFKDSSGQVHPITEGGNNWQPRTVDPYVSHAKDQAAAGERAKASLAKLGVTPESIKGNFRQMFEGVNASQMKVGMGDYERSHWVANSFSKIAATQGRPGTKVPVDTMSFAIASLSPHTPYTRNLVLARKGINIWTGQEKDQQGNKIDHLTLTDDDAAKIKEMSMFKSKGKNGKTKQRQGLDIKNYNGIEKSQRGKDFTGTHHVQDLPGDVLSYGFPGGVGTFKGAMGRFFHILKTGDVDAASQFPKVRSFGNNISNPWTDPYNSGTVDTHEIMGGLGKGRGGYSGDAEKTVRQIMGTPDLSKVFDKSLREVADEKGVRTHQMQAVGWHEHRDKNELESGRTVKAIRAYKS